MPTECAGRPSTCFRDPYSCNPRPTLSNRTGRCLGTAFIVLPEPRNETLARREQCSVGTLPRDRRSAFWRGKDAESHSLGGNQP